MESAFPWGGKIQVTRSGTTWNIFGQAERIKIEEPFWELLINDKKEADVTASNVHFALLQPAAKQVGCRVTTNISENTLSISF